jgi:hypothetical protein
MAKEYQIISEQIIDQQGSFKRVRRWYEGHHSELGVLTSGWQGEPQTIQEVDVISPVVRFTVYEGNTTKGK